MRTSISICFLLVALGACARNDDDAQRPDPPESCPHLCEADSPELDCWRLPYPQPSYCQGICYHHGCCIWDEDKDKWQRIVTDCQVPLPPDTSVDAR